MILGGLTLLARGRRDGIKQFGNTPDALGASFAPLIAFPLVGAGLNAVHGDWHGALILFLSRFCAVLVVPVITFEYARLAGRRDEWLRTATALNWSFWILLPLGLAAAILAAGLQSAGVGPAPAEYAGIGFILAYLAWLSWFILRAGLRIGAISAILLTLLNAAAVALLTIGAALG